MSTGGKLAPGDAHLHLPQRPPTPPKDRVIFLSELQSVSPVQFPKPRSLSPWFSLAHSPGQTSLPSSRSSAPCILNIHKSSLCSDWKTLQSWKTGSPAHRGNKGGGGDITVPANRKMRKNCCLGTLSNNRLEMSREQSDYISTNHSWLPAFQLHKFH